MSTHQYPWENPDRVSYADMNYLLSEGARSRYLIAAHYVRGCPIVVEIGGFKTPVTGYLTHTPKRVLMVDPIMPEYHSEELHGKPCRVDHVRGLFQEYEFDLPRREYGFVCLGLSLKRFSDESASRSREWQKWLDLVNDSRIAIIEYPIEWELGSDLAQQTLADTKTDLIMQVDLDLSESPGMDTIHSRRRLMVLRPIGD